MGITQEAEIKALTNMALTSSDLSTAVGCLVRARLLQPAGKLEAGYGFVKGNTSPQEYYEERRKLIVERFEAGAKLGKLPKMVDLADEFSCSLSVVHEVKQEWLKEQEAA
jgi:hypothetical protein